MFNPSPALPLSALILDSFQVKMFVEHQNRIPQNTTTLVVSNHRSFMDALILMQALQKPLRIACHYYMGQVPILKELVSSLGCFPLAKPNQRGRRFLKQGSQFLENRQWLGIFPEGGQPMVKLSSPRQVGKFEPGFAHLAFTAKVEDLMILPVAIASSQERVQWSFPVQLLQLFDADEPLFIGSHWHPVVMYERVQIIIGRPYWITPGLRSTYQGRDRKVLANHLCDYCRQEIMSLL
ncbi:MAG: 1-acyl-sn-glycerol-3-phosphate acyltransferase [Gloeocapsa sp. DLM2.Bin57]|nr:MAG: 1-acyl-sn-glycerol-3-phosphate acyltransferase [Gloeocapsa sp. DLM2.Bin57]